MSADGGTWTVRRILEWTAAFFIRKNVDSPRLSAELLLAHVLNVPRLRLYTDYDRPLAESDLSRYRELVRRAAEHEPIAYLTGRAHFFNMEFEVTPEVLIPRPDTETLVENVLQLCRNQAGFEAPRVLDLCTGSGCIAAAIAQHRAGSMVIATDVSPAAAEVARRNIDRLGLAERVLVLEGDLYDALAGQAGLEPFHLIVSNPPYIPSSDIERLDRNVRDYEPLQALDGGADGLAVIRRILAAASQWLIPGGRLFVEIQFDQGHAVRDLAEAQPGLCEARVLKDYAGHDRVVAATHGPA